MLDLDWIAVLLVIGVAMVAMSCFGAVRALFTPRVLPLTMRLWQTYVARRNGRQADVDRQAAAPAGTARIRRANDRGDETHQGQTGRLHRGPAARNRAA